MSVAVGPDATISLPTWNPPPSGLDDVGVTTAQFATTLITGEEATRLGCTGSPTIMVNGQDLFAVAGYPTRLGLPGP